MSAVNCDQLGPPAAALICAALAGDDHTVALIVSYWVTTASQDDMVRLLVVCANVAAGMIRFAADGDERRAAVTANRMLDGYIRSRARQLGLP